MSDIHLPGFKGSEPIGFLAALGYSGFVLAVRRWVPVKLGWEPEGGYAAFVVEAECDADRLIDELLDHMRRPARAPSLLRAAGCRSDDRRGWVG